MKITKISFSIALNSFVMNFCLLLLSYKNYANLKQIKKKKPKDIPPLHNYDLHNLAESYIDAVHAYTAVATLGTMRRKLHTFILTILIA
jgi:hypothetical protein